MKELFEKKLAVKWAGSKRQQYDALERWAILSNQHQLENIQTELPSSDSILYKIVLGVPAIHSFEFAASSESSSIFIKSFDKSQV